MGDLWLTQPDGLKNGDKMPELFNTLSAKGILIGISGVPELADVTISRDQIVANYRD